MPEVVRSFEVRCFSPKHGRERLAIGNADETGTTLTYPAAAMRKRQIIACVGTSRVSSIFDSNLYHLALFIIEGNIIDLMCNETSYVHDQTLASHP